MKKILFILLVVVTFSCAKKNTLEDARKVKIGITTNELKYLMGEPFEVEVNSDDEDWYFTYISGSYRMGMHVTIIENKVVEFYSY